MPAALRNRALRLRLTQPLDELWDRRLGIHTFGHRPGSGRQGDAEWYLHYAPTPYRDLFRVMRAASLGANDIFTDLGAGMGRAVFAASWLGARRAIGIELLPDLAAIAEQNRRNSRLRDRDIVFRAANALDESLLGTTLLYMFHPFGEQVMERVLAQARRARADAGVSQPLRIIYVNPVCEDVLAASGWLRQVDDLPPRPQLLSTAKHYRATIWRSV